MNRVFTAWAAANQTQASCLVAGEGPPRFGNGEVDPTSPILLWRIEVGTFEEAKAILNLRNGWEPYRPAGEAKPCSACGSLGYPEGSGECWKCGHAS
jgi:hypothetical protein